MDEFKKQIIDDLEIIKKEFSDINKKVLYDEYSFNYWILSRLYNVDEEVIYSHITEGNDKSIDCFVHFEDTKELYIIQNKYYDLDTPICREHVADFLKTPLSVLLKGNYKRSSELQKIFDKARLDPEYKIWLHFYISNNKMNDDVDNLISEFDYENKNVTAFVGVKIFYLNDIQNIYFGERFNNKTSFTAILPTTVKATSLDIRAKEYKLPWMIDVRYVMVNIGEVYRMYKDSIKQNYEIFDENIREYLGKSAINKKIIDTLKSPADRENFFYYNNGLTITCKACSTLDSNQLTASHRVKYQYGFKLKNPQIVNGCQTINSIYEALSHYSDDKIDIEFEKCFVLTKVFVFDDETSKKKPNLEKNIIRYTNSQNAINEKAFASKKVLFENIQKEFQRRGLLLLVKPSDKNKFISEYEDLYKFGSLKTKSKLLLDFFDIKVDKVTDFMIPLEKLIQVLLAFNKDGYAAFTKKDHVLRANSELYKDFSLNLESFFTIDNMLKLYLTYKKAEREQKVSYDKRSPIPYYLVSAIGYKFKNKQFSDLNDKLRELFSDKNNFCRVYDFCRNLTGFYADEYYREKSSDYNKMIKQEIEYIILDRCIRQQIKFSGNDPLIKDLFEIQ